MAGVKDQILKPMGHEQIVNPATSTALTVPAGASVALLNCSSGADGLRIRGDAVAPTASVGIKLETNAKLWWTGNLRSVRVIVGAPAGAGVLDIEYFA